MGPSIGTGALECAGTIGGAGALADCSAMFHEAPFSLTLPVLPCVAAMGFIYQEDPEVGLDSGTVYQALGSLGSITGWSCPCRCGS